MSFHCHIIFSLALGGVRLSFSVGGFKLFAGSGVCPALQLLAGGWGTIPDNLHVAYPLFVGIFSRYSSIPTIAVLTNTFSHFL